MSSSDFEYLVQIVSESKRTAVLTGAGVSTASGIPDYRGPGGAYTTGYQPMSHQEFMGKEKARSRYWSRNYAGWEAFKARLPNRCHLYIAELEKFGWIDFVITQNVDRLHTKAGSRDVVELHGTTHNVICTACGDLMDRERFQTILSRLNPNAYQEWDSDTEIRKTRPMVRPDGDIDIDDSGKHFLVPPCSRCNGILKPDVVFFGDSVPRERGTMAYDICSESETLLVVGSSVMVYSAYRLVRAAKENGAKVVIINVGETRADDLCDLKIECNAEEVLTRLASQPEMCLPRVRKSL